MDGPREWTRAEVRDKFINQVYALIDYWEAESRVPTSRGKMEGLVHSIFVIVDGESMALPAFHLVPNPHEEDRAFHIDEGENWYPVSDGVCDVVCDIAGDLHNRYNEVRHNDDQENRGRVPDLQSPQTTRSDD